MKQELQDQLVDILASISNTVGQAKDFALGQLPDIAQSYVLFGRFYETTNALLGLAVAFAFFYAMRWAYKNPWQGEYGETRGASNILAQIGFGLGAFTMLYCSMYPIKKAALVWFAPKVWLLKEIASLIK